MYAINVNISCSALNELENRIPILVSVQMNGEVECKKKGSEAYLLFNLC